MRWLLGIRDESADGVLQQLQERLLHTHVVAFFAGHADCGMRGWDDTAHGIHEVILPCVSYNNDRKLDKAPGFAVSELRPAWTRVDVHPTKLVLNVKPVGADVAATKELPLK